MPHPNRLAGQRVGVGLTGRLQQIGFDTQMIIDADVMAMERPFVRSGSTCVEQVRQHRPARGAERQA